MEQRLYTFRRVDRSMTPPPAKRDLLSIADIEADLPNLIARAGAMKAARRGATGPRRVRARTSR